MLLIFILKTEAAPTTAFFSPRGETAQVVLTPQRIALRCSHYGPNGPLLKHSSPTGVPGHNVPGPRMSSVGV